MVLQQGGFHHLRISEAWEPALIRDCGRRLTTKIYGLPSGCKGSESRTGTTRGASCTHFAPSFSECFREVTPPVGFEPTTGCLEGSSR